MTGPGCSCCYDDAFDRKHAEAKLRDYRRNGPGRASVALANALAKGGVSGRSVLDIGAGVGAVHHLLLERGAARATDVDASRPYLDAARSEAERRGFADRVRFEHGDFVAIAPAIEPADLVALDRVACCYGDVDRLVERAAERTRRRLGIVIPPDGPFGRAVIGILNAWEIVTRSSFRMYAHRYERVTAAARRAGLEPVGPILKIGVWRLLVFERPIRIADPG